MNISIKKHDVASIISQVPNAREVYLALLDPRMQIWCGMLRQMHPWAEHWYAVFQERGGRDKQQSDSAGSNPGRQYT
jgi:hypothetical protein